MESLMLNIQTEPDSAIGVCLTACKREETKAAGEACGQSVT
jgi:hypothetical protein